MNRSDSALRHWAVIVAIAIVTAFVLSGCQGIVAKSDGDLSINADQEDEVNILLPTDLLEQSGESEDDDINLPSIEESPME